MLFNNASTIYIFTVVNKYTHKIQITNLKSNFASNLSERKLLSCQRPSIQKEKQTIASLFSLHSPHTSPFKLRPLFQFRFFSVRRPIIPQAPFCGRFSSSKEAHKESKCLSEPLNQQFMC